MGLQLDTEFAKAIAPVAEAWAQMPKPAPHDIATRRKSLPVVESTEIPTVPDGVACELIRVSTADGFELPVYRLRRTAKPSNGAAVIHTHPGGYILLSAHISIPKLAQLALETGVQFFTVDYRLAPEHPYPAALDDSWTALSYVKSHSAELGVNEARIAVMGESAGGGLAAALALRARELDLSPPLARQILIYPMLDDRTREKVLDGIFTFWNESDNLTGWTAYLGGTPGGDNIPVFAAPGRIQDVTGLPPLYIDVGQLDIFVKENVDYARKFIEAGIETELHVYPGVPHGFEAAGPGVDVVKKAEANRLNAVLKL